MITGNMIIDLLIFIAIAWFVSGPLTSLSLSGTLNQKKGKKKLGDKINSLTNEEIAKEFAEEKLNIVKTMLSNDYKTGYEEGVRHYLDSRENSEDMVSAIKEIRAKEEHWHNKKIFCIEHNLELESILCNRVEDELRRVCSMLQSRFNTGYVSINK